MEGTIAVAKCLYFILKLGELLWSGTGKKKVHPLIGRSFVSLNPYDATATMAWN